MANLFHAVLNGNLTADATFKKIADDKAVINFTIAHNFPTNKKDDEEKTIYEPQFYNCTRWVNYGTEPNDLNKLTKGAKITIEVQKIDISTTTQEEKKYTNVNFILSNIII